MWLVDNNQGLLFGKKILKQYGLNAVVYRGRSMYVRGVYVMDGNYEDNGVDRHKGS